jgi:hypothetical protein
MLDANRDEMNRERRGVDGNAERKLLAVKCLHTLVWAFFVSCIVSMPILGAKGQFRLAGVVFGIVMLECFVLVANGWRCPMTDWAAQYTEDREANFDIFLPRWLAVWNKTIFSILFILNGILICMEYYWARVR